MQLSVNKNKLSSKYLSGRICYKCGKYGHISTMCTYKPKYRFLQPATSDYIVIKGSQALQMERQQFEIDQLMKDYKNFFREYHKRMKEVSKIDDIKKQVNLFKKQARNIQTKYENYKMKSKKINHDIKKFNHDLKKMQITDILKDMIKNANKDLVEMYKKSFQQALNPNYRGGNEKLADIIRNDLKFDENGHVSNKYPVEKSPNLKRILKAFENQKIDLKIVDKIFEVMEKGKDLNEFINEKITNKALKEKITEILSKLGCKIISKAKIEQVNNYYSSNDIHNHLIVRLKNELHNEISDMIVEKDIAEREYLKYQGKYSDLINKGFAGPKDAQYEQEYSKQMMYYKKIFNAKNKQIKDYLANTTSSSQSPAIRRFIQDSQKNNFIYDAYLREIIKNLTPQ
jgi:hypothetical protein